MRAGRLDKRVQLLRPSETKDALGTPQRTYSPVVKVWAEVAPLRGREYFAAQAAHSDVSHQVTFRYSTTVEGIGLGWRIGYGPRVFEVQYAMNSGEDDREIVAYCVERTA